MSDDQAPDFSDDERGLGGRATEKGVFRNATADIGSGGDAPTTDSKAAQDATIAKLKAGTLETIKLIRDIHESPKGSGSVAIQDLFDAFGQSNFVAQLENRLPVKLLRTDRDRGTFSSDDLKSLEIVIKIDTAHLDGIVRIPTHFQGTYRFEDARLTLRFQEGEQISGCLRTRETKLGTYTIIDPKTVPLTETTLQSIDGSPDDVGFDATGGLVRVLKLLKIQRRVWFRDSP